MNPPLFADYLPAIAATSCQAAFISGSGFRPAERAFVGRRGLAGRECE